MMGIMGTAGTKRHGDVRRAQRQEMEPGFSVPADRGYRGHDRVRSAEGATGATVEDITAVFG